MANSALLSTSERNIMGRERLLACLSECGAENEPVVLLELQKAYFNKFDEYLNKAELRKFFSKGHIKQVFENFMPKDVAMSTDVNATGSLFLKMKRPLQIAIADVPKSAPLITMPKNSSEANRPNLVPLSAPSAAEEQPPPVVAAPPSRSKTAEDKFKLPSSIMPNQQFLAPNRKESFSLTGGFGGVAVNEKMADKNDLLEDFVPRHGGTKAVAAVRDGGGGGRGGGSETSTLVAYDANEAHDERRGGKEKFMLPSATAATAAMRRGAVAPTATMQTTKPSRTPHWGDEDDEDEAADEGDSSGDLLGDSALEDGYQQLKKQAAAIGASGGGGRAIGASSGSNRAAAGDRRGGGERSGGGDKQSSGIQQRRGGGVAAVFAAAASSDDDVHDHDAGGDEKRHDAAARALQCRSGGSFLEAKWADERRARDAVVAERLRNRKQHEQPQRAAAATVRNRNSDWSDDWGDVEEVVKKQHDAGADDNDGKRKKNSDEQKMTKKPIIGGGVDRMASFGVAVKSRATTGAAAAKPKPYGGKARFMQLPPFAPNLMSSDEDEEVEEQHKQQQQKQVRAVQQQPQKFCWESEEESETKKNNKALQQDVRAVQQQQKKKSNVEEWGQDEDEKNDEDEEDDDGNEEEEEEEEEGPMVTMNRSFIDEKDEKDEQLEEDLFAGHQQRQDTTPEELQDEETEQFYKQFSTGSTNMASSAKSKKFSVDERNKFIGLISITMSMLKNVNSTELDKKLVSISPSGDYRKAFPSAADLLTFITNNCPNIKTFKVSKDEVALLWSERSEELVTLLLQGVGKMILKECGAVAAAGSKTNN